jgi:hypothetical protein
MIFEELFIKHGAASFDKQIYFDAMYGKARWALDLSTGVLALTRPHEEPVQLFAQVLGTESEDNGTWLWAWANGDQKFSQPLLQSALELRNIGTNDNVAELAAPELSCGRWINGQTLSAVASGLCRAGCTFRAPYPRGALHLIIRDPRFKRPVSQPIPRILRAFPMFLQRYPLRRQREALLHYLDFYRLEIETHDGSVRARAATQSRNSVGLAPANALIAEFSPAGTLTRFEALD